MNRWTLIFKGFNPKEEGLREALCTLGNGYFATRGSTQESAADEIHYPGTYLAGGYNRLSTDISGHRCGERGPGEFSQLASPEFSHRRRRLV